VPVLEMPPPPSFASLNEKVLSVAVTVPP
jgi:hypothetical protein